MKLQKIENQISLHNNTYLTKSVFFKDTKLEYIFKKTEKISMAIYLVTNFFVSEEPLKWSLRKSATNLLNSVLTYSSSPLSFKEEKNINFHNEILSMVSYLDLAFHSGFISTMNYHILADELDRLIQEIAEYNGHSQQGGWSQGSDSGDNANNNSNTYTNSNERLFNEDYFKVQKSLRDDVADGAVGSDYKGQNNYARRNPFMSYRNEVNDNKGQGQNATSNRTLNATQNSTPKDTSNNAAHKPKKTKRTSEENLQRQEKILDEIGRKGIVSIKDIESVLPKYSTKTLQRELLKMVEIGLLEKKGERRWSRYSLKKS